VGGFSLPGKRVAAVEALISPQRLRPFLCVDRLLLNAFLVALGELWVMVEVGVEERAG
jgi:hypothetical protein